MTDQPESRFTPVCIPATFASFITTLGGTENAVTIWRLLGASVKRIDLLIEGECVRLEHLRWTRGHAHALPGATRQSERARKKPPHPAGLSLWNPTAALWPQASRYVSSQTGAAARLQAQVRQAQAASNVPRCSWLL